MIHPWLCFFNKPFIQQEPDYKSVTSSTGGTWTQFDGLELILGFLAI